jgi:hypothetical protein
MLVVWTQILFPAFHLRAIDTAFSTSSLSQVIGIATDDEAWWMKKPPSPQ